MTNPLRSSAHRYCRPCARGVVPRPRARFAGVGLGLVIALTLALIGFSALIGPFIMFTLPLILVAGFAMGPLVGVLSAPDLCPECGRELRFTSRREAALSEERIGAPRGTARARPSVASDMKEV